MVVALMAKVSEFEPIDSRVPESLMRRLVLDAAGQRYGTKYGAMRLRGQINDAQFSACKWFDELHARYLAALEVKGIKTSTGERYSKGHPPDPFSPVGWDIADAENILVRRYDAARLAGLGCGRVAFKLFWFVVIEEGMPTGYACVKAVGDVSAAIEDFRTRDSKRKRK